MIDNFSPPPQDDVMDVIEITETLVKHIHELLHECDYNIAVSVILNATVQILLSQCASQKEFQSLKYLFVKFFDEYNDRITEEKAKKIQKHDHND